MICLRLLFQLYLGNLELRRGADARKHLELFRCSCLRLFGLCVPVKIQYVSLEAQLPIQWVPVLGSLYKLILSITQEPTIWVPGLLLSVKILCIPSTLGLVVATFRRPYSTNFVLGEPYELLCVPIVVT